MRDSWIYYRSFYEAWLALSDAQRGKFYTMIFEYMFNFTKWSSDDPIVDAMFCLVAPQVEANIRKYKNWKKAKKKQDGSKVEAKEKQSVSETQGNVNDNDNVNDNKDVYRNFAHLEISTQEFDKLTGKWYTKLQVDDIFDRIENFKNNKKYKSLYLTSLTRLKKQYPEQESKSKEKELTPEEHNAKVLASFK